jgi:hypothetical protein
MACPSESPEWLTPTAIFAAMNTNKELRKMVPPPLYPAAKALFLVNGGLMAALAQSGPEVALNQPLTIAAAKSA